MLVIEFGRKNWDFNVFKVKGKALVVLKFPLLKNSNYSFFSSDGKNSFHFSPGVYILASQKNSSPPPQVLLQILPRFSIWTKNFPLPGGMGEMGRIYIPASPYKIKWKVGLIFAGEELNTLRTKPQKNPRLWTNKQFFLCKPSIYRYSYCSSKVFFFQ